MPPLASTKEPPLSIYTILLVVAAAFLALATMVTWSELTSDYDFMRTEGYVVEEEEEPAEESVEEPAE